MVLRERGRTFIVVINVGIISIRASHCETIIIVNLFLVSDMILAREKISKPVNDEGEKSNFMVAHKLLVITSTSR